MEISIKRVVLPGASFRIHGPLTLYLLSTTICRRVSLPVMALLFLIWARKVAIKFEAKINIAVVKIANYFPRRKTLPVCRCVNILSKCEYLSHRINSSVRFIRREINLYTAASVFPHSLTLVRTNCPSKCELPGQIASTFCEAVNISMQFIDGETCLPTFATLVVFGLVKRGWWKKGR